MTSNDRIHADRRRRRHRAVWRGRARDGGTSVPEPTRDAIDAPHDAAERVDREAPHGEAETREGSPTALGPYETRYDVAPGYDAPRDIVRP